MCQVQTFTCPNYFSPVGAIHMAFCKGQIHRSDALFLCQLEIFMFGLHAVPTNDWWSTSMRIKWRKWPPSKRERFWKVQRHV
jgi:hypothetical protein